MRVSVDRDRCQGHARCVLVAPDLFDLDGESRAEVLADPVPDGLDGFARDATEGCPEEAISVIT